MKAAKLNPRIQQPNAYSDCVLGSHEALRIGPAEAPELHRDIGMSPSLMQIKSSVAFTAQRLFTGRNKYTADVHENRDNSVPEYIRQAYASDIYYYCHPLSIIESDQQHITSLVEKRN